MVQSHARVGKSQQTKRRQRDPFWWWEDIESRISIKSILGSDVEDDTAPPKHPPFESEPPINAYAH